MRVTWLYIMIGFWAGGALGFFTAALLRLAREEPESLVWHGESTGDHHD